MQGVSCVAAVRQGHSVQWEIITSKSTYSWVYVAARRGADEQDTRQTGKTQLSGGRRIYREWQGVVRQARRRCVNCHSHTRHVTSPRDMTWRHRVEYVNITLFDVSLICRWCDVMMSSERQMTTDELFCCCTVRRYSVTLSWWWCLCYHVQPYGRTAVVIRTDGQWPCDQLINLIGGSTMQHGAGRALLSLGSLGDHGSFKVIENGAVR